MANRVLRDWTTSEKIESLSADAEVFFTRLIMKADDYGSYHANIKLLKAALFPLKDYALEEVGSWLSECVKAELIGMYCVQGKSYIRIFNFGQRLQNMRNAFPAPEDEFPKVTVSHGDSPLETNRNETEKKQEPANADDSFEVFFEMYGKKVDRVKAEKKWEKISKSDRDKIMQHIPKYVASTPDKAFRKNPSTYLESRTWDDEIVSRQPNAKDEPVYKSPGFRTNNQEWMIEQERRIKELEETGSVTESTKSTF